MALQRLLVSGVGLVQEKCPALAVLEVATPWNKAKPVSSGKHGGHSWIFTEDARAEDCLDYWGDVYLRFYCICPDKKPLVPLKRRARLMPGSLHVVPFKRG